ncbi:hypothetical protein KAR91_43065 [Candidatus Pacearchaeota archaeon]|nr:hypothetical protein [Candidatus Pacearchaeota archaeon]
MGSTTTFAALIAEPTSEKVFLAEINVAEHLKIWTLTGGEVNTYEISYLNETITLTDDSTEIIRKVISSIEEDGTALTERANIPAVEANAGSWWHDTANAKLYVHATGSDDPDNYTIIGFFWLYFATEGIILNGKYYEPYLAENGIPGLQQSSPNLYWGVSSIGGGDLTLLNGRGFFDQISKVFIWTNKRARILLGGDSLPYGEYATLYTGKIIDKAFTRREFRLNVGTSSIELIRQIPINKFWTSTYANLDPAAEGWPIPYYYGIYNTRHAPEVTCIDTAFGVNTYQFRICDHAINSITQVYVNYGDGVGWQNIAHANEDLANATFTIVAAAFEIGITQVKVAFEGKASAGSVIEGAPEIVEDLLINVLGFSAADLLAASFTSSQAESDVTLNVPIRKEISAVTVIEGICRSDLAFFDEDEDGLFRYRTWVPYIGGTYKELDDTDFLGIPEIREDAQQLYYLIKIGYSYACPENEYLYHDESDSESERKYGRRERLLLDTYLRGVSDATILAQRLKLLVKDPTPMLNASLKIPVIDQLLGHKLIVTMARSPYAVPGGWDKRYFEISSRAISCFPVRNNLTMFDLKEFGRYVGYWTDAAAPTWGAASEADKATDGYWCDANGYAAPADSDSQNVSLWW